MAFIEKESTCEQSSLLFPRVRVARLIGSQAFISNFGPRFKFEQAQLGLDLLQIEISFSLLLKISPRHLHLKHCIEWRSGDTSCACSK